MSETSDDLSAIAWVHEELRKSLEGAHKALVVRDYCVRHGLALERSFAYSDSFSDYPMLAVVGHPAAVNPDARLARVARAYEWPIIRTTEG